jgi:hypothetical protein
VPIFATWRPNNENEANVAIEALEAGTLKVTDVLLGDEFFGGGLFPYRYGEAGGKLSHQAFMAKLVEVALSYIYSGSLPERLFWIFDSTHTEKPHAKKAAGLKWFHRMKKVDGRAKNLKGHCYVFAAPLYRQTTGKMISWASILTGALLNGIYLN